MAEEIVGVKIKVDGSEAVQSTKSLREQLREAQREVVTLADKFGATSQQAVEAAKRTAELRDKIGDAKSLVDAFNPDAKFKAVTASLSGVAGGFAAVQGAMGLMGVEGENVQKTLLKVQSAMAISQGLQSLGESIDSFKQLGAVIKNTTVFQNANNAATKAAAVVQKLFTGAVNETSVGFQALKGAIAATGIGLLVVGLGTLITKIMEWTSGTKDAEDAQNSLNDALERQTELLQDNLKEIDYSTKALAARAKIAGKSEEELNKISKEGAKQRNDELKANYDRLLAIEDEARKNKNLSAEDQKKIREATTKAQKEWLDDGLKMDLKDLEDKADIAEKARKKQEEANKAAHDKSVAAAKERADKAKQLQKEKDAAELDAQDQIIKLKNETEVLGIQDQYKAKRAAIDNQLMEEIAHVNANEKLKAETKQALIIALGNKANADIAAINKDQADEQAKKDKEALLKKQEDERGIRELGLQQKIELLDKENSKIDGDYEKDLERLELKKELLQQQMDVELENSELTEFQKTEIRKKYADERAKVADQELEVEKAAQQAKVDLNNKYLDLFAQFGGFLQQIAGKNKALAIAGVVVEQAASIGRIISNTGVANAKAVAASPLTGGMPWVALNSVSAGLSIASSVAAGVKAVQQINSAQPGGGGGSAVTAGGSAAPMSPSAPIQNTRTELTQQSVNQLGSATNRAYVIESDVSNSQERIKRINRAARLS